MGSDSAGPGRFLPDDESQGTVDGTIPARYTLSGIIPRPARHQLLRESLAAAVAERRAQDAEAPEGIAPGDGEHAVNEGGQARSVTTAAAALRGWVAVEAAENAVPGPVLEEGDAAPLSHAAAPDSGAGGGTAEAALLVRDLFSRV